ncbi:T9SS type A sorting domain-containing protein [Chondrinema litorale]|uniref:T9SS type A sorting domain-containing protein n=1 Tax=Chondrinema litorale TaxID=2994555 RepID=UPI0025435EF4|nr:T9SS type A sorting domain-containing protein [Chondrinema litorale]UZR96425.1 T9SS type A sorting domain-containing protein [Chondrinema litorale]
MIYTKFNLIFTFLFCLLLTNYTLAQVTIEDEELESDDNFSSSMSFTYNAPSANKRLIILGISAEFSGANAVSSITYGGNSLTEINDISVGSPQNQYAALFYINDDGISSRSNNTINIIFNDASNNIRECFASLVLLSNADQNTPVSESRTSSANSDTELTVNTDIEAFVNDMVVSVIADDDNGDDLDALDGFTELHNENGSRSTHAFSYLEITTDGDYTPGFEIDGGGPGGGGSSNSRMALAAVRINSSTTNPGGIGDALELWVKADSDVLNGGANANDGDDVDEWSDQSGSRSNELMPRTLDAPTFRNNTTDNVNFNPTIEFDGTNTALSLGNDYIYSSSDGLTIFSVVVPDNNAASKDRQFIVDFGFHAEEGYGFTYSSNNMFSYTSINHGGGAIDNTHSNGTNPVILTFDADFSSTTGLYINNSLLTSTSSTPSALTATEIRESTNPAAERGPFTLGSQAKSGNIDWDDYRRFDGKISEVLVYSKDMSSVEIQQIESYLAIKYGITIGSISNTFDYVDSDGSVIWNGNSTYQNDIAGIGRDDDSGLNQKQSRSNNSDAILSIGLNNIEDTNSENTSTFTTDKSFLIWGNNGQIGESDGYDDVGTTEEGEEIEIRMKRIWYVENTNNIGSVKLQFDMSGVPDIDGLAGGNDLQYVRLLIDEDGTFASGASSILYTTYDNSTDIIEFDHEFTSSDGFYFTLGSVNAAVTSLPVDLLYFNTKLTDNKPYLSWATSSESNNDYFEVLRSFDGTNWESITTINGKGNSDEMVSYYYHDTELNTSNTTIYYMLKQVDYDGNFEYSDINSVQLPSNKAIIYIYPNPVEDILNVNFLSNQTKSHNIIFVDITGNVIESISTSENQNEIDIRHLTSGLYIIRVSETATHEILINEKIVITK